MHTNQSMISLSEYSKGAEVSQWVFDTNYNLEELESYLEKMVKPMGKDHNIMLTPSRKTSSRVSIVMSGKVEVIVE